MIAMKKPFEIPLKVTRASSSGSAKTGKPEQDCPAGFVRRDFHGRPDQNCPATMPDQDGLVTLLCAICIVFALIIAHPAFSAEKAGDDMPIALRMVLLKAEKAFEKNDFKEGIRILAEFKTSGNDGSDHYLIDFLEGNGRLQTGQLEKAAENYRSATEKKPDFSAAHMNLAKCLYDIGRYEKAAEAFQKGYETSEEKNPEILYYAAASYLSAEKNAKAIPVLERLVALNTPKAGDEWKETLVHAYIADGKPQKAIPFMEQLVAKFTGEKKMQWQENLLYQYLALDMKSKALSLAEKLVEDNPEEPKWWKTLAHIHLSGNREKQALVALTIYGFLTPLDEKEKKLLADLNLMLGVPKKAVSFYETLHGASGSDELLEKIVQCHRMAGQTEKALEWVERGLARNEARELLMTKGEILYEAKRYDQAIAAFEAAATKKGDDPGRPWLMIGYSAWLKDDLKKARSAFEKAAGHKRHEKDALANIERIDKLLKSKT